LILDTSALVAILQREPGWEDLLDRILRDRAPAVGAPTLAEAGIVLTARVGQDGKRLVASFLLEFEVAVVPFVDSHWKVAVDAHRRYGKGRHPAGLNLGDCLTYATAKLANQPLLFTGRDFAKTDLEIA
jgi:ribonuclease VapC